MKYILGFLFLTSFCGISNAAPYVQGLWTKNAPVYISQDVVLMPTSLAYDRTFTNIAVVYHPLSSGSMIPVAWRQYLPPESWACTVGAGYGAGSGAGTDGGFGCGLNLLDSVRGWASNLLSLSSNATLNAIGDQIKPGVGPLNLFAARQYDDSQVHPGRFAPRWAFGASFGF